MSERTPAMPTFYRTESSTFVVVCRACGAFVADVEAHIDWHRVADTDGQEDAR